jgi:DNA adenine methylase
VSVREIDDQCLGNIAQPSRVLSPFLWFGGKGNLAKKILPYLPKGKVYVEPFCGAASIFWHLPEPYGVEVLNDLNGEIVNLFRVLQDTTLFEEFRHRTIWTPYSLDEFRKALSVGPDAPPIDRAWAFFVRQNQGFGGIAKSEGTWSRTFGSRRGMAKKACSWRGRMKLLDTWHDRLTRVQIDNRCALKVIEYWDSPDTVFYIDPPYALDTRVGGKVYDHECEDDFHHNLVSLLLTLKGKVALSGYATDIYAPLESAGWARVDIKTACMVSGRTRQSAERGTGSAMKNHARTESLWLSDPLTCSLFEHANEG